MPSPEPSDDAALPRTVQERPPGAFEPSAPPPVGPGTGAPLGAGARLAAGVRRYAPTRTLGRGAQGEVVLCRDVHVGRDVALKRMTAKARRDEGAIARFLREARVQGQLEHPAVVPVHDLDADDEGTAFFTMKCLRGKTLSEILRAQRRGDPGAERFPRRRLLGAFAAVCLAVDYAHSRGVIHRDIKPDNLMLGEYGEVYVLDWGIAKLLNAPGDTILDGERDGVGTEVGTIMGTCGYMPPEQARGALADIDSRSDVYALGAVLFEILTLTPLHEKDTWAAMLMATVDGVNAKASERAPDRDVPPELDAVCIKATCVDPAERHQSARELHDAVERFLEGDRDLELRRQAAAAHARAAEEAAGRSPAEDAVRVALAEAGRALALEPTNTAALRVVAGVLSAAPREIPAAVAAETEAHAAARNRLQLRQAIGADLAGITLMTPIALWMGLRTPAVLVAAVALSLAAAGMKVVASRCAAPRSMFRAAFAAYLGNVLSIVCIGSGFGPLLFMPALLTAFTLGYCMTYNSSFRVAVAVTGAVAVLASFGAEIAGLVPPSYAFHDGAMIILPRAVTLSPLPTLIGLLVSSVFLVIVPGVLMARLQDTLQRAEQRAFLQTFRLANLLPDEARGPRSPVSTPSAAPPR